MEFKDESAGHTVTSSSDVINAGAPSEDVNQPLIQPGGVAPVMSPAGFVAEQPQSAITQPTSPPVDPPALEPDGPFTAVHAAPSPAEPPVPASYAELHQADSQLCPPAEQIAHLPSSPVNLQVQQSGEAITAGAQVTQPGDAGAQVMQPDEVISGGVQVTPPGEAITTGAQVMQPGEAITGDVYVTQPAPQHEHPAAVVESVSTLSQNVEQSLVIAEPSADLQPQTADDLASTTQQLQQPTGMPAGQQQLPDMTSATAMAHASAQLLAETTPPTVLQQQRVDQLSTVGLQQPPDAVTFADQPVESLQPPETLAAPDTPAVEQAISKSAVVPTAPEGQAAVQLSVTECQPPAVSTEQQLPNTVADTAGQQPAADYVQEKVVEPAVLSSESTPPSEVRSPYPADATGGDAAWLQPCPPTVAEVEPVEQAEAPWSSQQPAPGDPTPPAAAQVDDRQRQDVIQVEKQTDDIVDQRPPHDDVVMATPNDVTGMHDVSAGSDTDDAPEVIADSLSRDRDATNQHDHQHPSVGRRY